MQHVKAPQDRVGVLIGEGSSMLREVKNRAEVRLNVNSENDSVAINSVGDPILSMVAPDVVRAVGRDFAPGDAMALLDGGMVAFELIDIDRHTRNKNDMWRQKNRLVGENGRTRELMGELTGADVVIYDTTPDIIGRPEEAEVTRRATEMVLGGAPHGVVYSFLERKHNELTQGFDVRQNS